MKEMNLEPTVEILRNCMQNFKPSESLCKNIRVAGYWDEMAEKYKASSDTRKDFKYDVIKKDLEDCKTYKELEDRWKFYQDKDNDKMRFIITYLNMAKERDSLKAQGIDLGSEPQDLHPNMMAFYKAAVDLAEKRRESFIASVDKRYSDLKSSAHAKIEGILKAEMIKRDEELARKIQAEWNREGSNNARRNRVGQNHAERNHQPAVALNQVVVPSVNRNEERDAALARELQIREFIARGWNVNRGNLSKALENLQKKPRAIEPAPLPPANVPQWKRHRVERFNTQNNPKAEMIKRDEELARKIQAEWNREEESNNARRNRVERRNNQWVRAH